jgi:hypothetical protein
MSGKELPGPQVRDYRGAIPADVVADDLLDPVQVSARQMYLQSLKREVRRAQRLYENQGGLILDPSPYLTPDIPLENILAVYEGSQ